MLIVNTIYDNRSVAWRYKPPRNKAWSWQVAEFLAVAWHWFFNYFYFMPKSIFVSAVWGIFRIIITSLLQLLLAAFYSHLHHHIMSPQGCYVSLIFAIIRCLNIPQLSGVDKSQIYWLAIKSISVQPSPLFWLLENLIDLFFFPGCWILLSTRQIKITTLNPRNQ